MRTKSKIAFLFTAFAASAAFAAPKIESVPGEYVVRLKKDVLTANTKSQLGVKLKGYVKSTIPGQDIVVVKRAAFETEKSAVKTLGMNDLVEYAEPNFIYRINKTANDPLMDHLWGLKNVGQADSDGQIGTAGMDIDVEHAWDIATGSKDMIVAVIDTGVDHTHADLAENIWTNEAEANGVAGVDDDGNGVVDDIHGYNAIDGSGNAMDDHGHGSHCSGTIGAKGNDGKGIVGVNWDVRIMAVKFLSAEGSGTLEDAVKAIDYATKMGAKVLSNSWGGGGFSQTLMDSIKRSEEAGALFIAAAGNDYNNNDIDPTYPATYAVDNIVTVAAVDNTGKKADFSNYGKKTVHLGAPGVNVYSSTGGDYDSWSGTSMATPHVSGVAALVWSNEPNLTAKEVKERLLATAKPVAGLRGKTKTGGMVNAYMAVTNTMPAPDMNDPINWATREMSYQSASPYLPNTNETYEIRVDGGVREFALYFEKFETEAGYDTLKIYDEKGTLVQTVSGLQSETFSLPITGSYAKLVFKADNTIQKGGWKISKAAFR